MPDIRDRMLRCGFWNDGDLLRWPLAKRLLYCNGFPAIADYTGCFEDDPFAWKVQLFPSPVDTDITVDQLTVWRNELVEEGKLAPFAVDGRTYLYQPSFHRHQHLYNVGTPRLPWPEHLLAVEEHPTDRRKHIIRDADTGVQLQPSKANGTPIDCSTVDEGSVESSEG